MKAVEWSEKFKAATTPEEVAAVLHLFGAETAELITLRTKGSNDVSRVPAADGAVNEQRTKYRAVQTRVPELTTQQFEEMLDKSCADYRTAKAKASQTNQPTHENASNGGEGRKFGRGNFPQRDGTSRGSPQNRDSRQPART